VEEYRQQRRKGELQKMEELIGKSHKAKKEYHNRICDKIIEFQRRGHHDVIYMKTK
jgi:hypothetical protein